MNVTVNAITSCIFNRVAKLISRTKKNAQMIINGKYQRHSKALTKAGLDPKIFPTLK